MPNRTSRAKTVNRVEVSVADGVKCARCWLIKTDVGADAAYPDLCARCADVLSELDMNK